MNANVRVQRPKAIWRVSSSELKRAAIGAVGKDPGLPPGGESQGRTD